jgi:hypothetical protein
MPELAYDSVQRVPDLVAFAIADLSPLSEFRSSRGRYRGVSALQTEARKVECGDLSPLC